MKRTNYVLGLASILLGLLLIASAFQQGGISPTIGILFGGLLLINGVVRLKVARSGGGKRTGRGK